MRAILLSRSICRFSTILTTVPTTSKPWLARSASGYGHRLRWRHRQPDVDIGSKIQFRDDAPKVIDRETVQRLDDDSQLHVCPAAGATTPTERPDRRHQFNAGADGLDKIVVDSLTVNGQNGAVNPLQAIYVGANGSARPTTSSRAGLRAQTLRAFGAGFAQGGTLVGTIKRARRWPGKGIHPRVESDGTYTLTVFRPLSHPSQDNRQQPAPRDLVRRQPAARIRPQSHRPDGGCYPAS